ncbi:MarR family winged helix-turn-helix transcriptional regulator [Bordetella genomosp. 12]|uniref:MarR family transcriptional regulator n=1 Tax=Bordetella genomosp. 12 TaxID=463035 RepID=A0A261VWH3_9BORD|nr:MarR family transcriptional regulator [Bordetella genomosp. 12]OZI77842.1 MarR family transcriptional regulator [Bordetella genomosp. 12]
MTSATLSMAENTPTDPPAREALQENWDQRLGFLMHDVSRLRRKVFDEVMKPEGITRSQWWVMAHLSRHDGMSQSDLAERLDLGRAALGGLVDRLEAAGLVRRGADEQDRRAKLVFLTQEGSSVIERMRLKSDQMSEAILHGLSRQQRTQLAEMLSLVKANLLAFDELPAG